ncbi:hypothetical protein [Pseudonocardia asaccharolytica]|uniref:DNA-packaging protein n=1 Tax=Pseudonocardia asaccharolytica DSM 44247 = NBRC 16224 TaxID=1123024 RepID=A0A511CYS1_9PSEU|nr:hypothetical protein [Pseudonocardia asaccharolytica]GEL17686.1 hypothetical protein PA7_15230 [Pseudonocardia asaccharolytica DSM 44247 = NBRC 16224]
MAWPPTLTALKGDLGIDEADTRDDARLTSMLDAAVVFVQRVHAGGFDFAGDLGSTLPEPDADLVTGTLRLAGRWHTRRRSPDGLVAMAELGAARVPSFDPDIERLLRIGRYRSPVIA